MNSLSWMIYIADVVGSIKTITGTAVIVTVAFVGIVLLFLPLILDIDDDAGPALKRAIKPVAIFVIAVALIYTVTPSTNTIYAIAASEYGEEALKTPEATKARAALNAWLDAQLAEKKEGK